ncbi:copper resistance protein B [Sphingomonas sp. Leaf17]|uniref:copper resistance protein B n=1 Tax=Sphingomonas sp. Leaf17 TaxID=1735683 RepID=UPI003FA688AC
MPGMTMPAKRPTVSRPSAAKKAPVRPPARKAPVRPAARPVVDPHAGHAMPGMTMDGADTTDPHAGHDMSAMPGMEVTPGQTMRHDRAPMPGMAARPVGTDLKPGNAPAPAPSTTLAASRFYGEDIMRESNRDLRREHGGMTYYQLLFNLAEYQARSGRDGYRWDGAAWIGGDIDRLTLKSEGEGLFGQSLAAAEVQALYSRALDPYWNLQAGVRHDITPNPSRTYATIGIEGLAPYWFDVEGAIFLSDKGNVLARAEAWYDQRVTQFLVLQPRVEANFSAQDVRCDGIGSGLTNLELGLRLRYEKSREFAPYMGVSWERQFGDTAGWTKARGDGTGGFSFVAGVRIWF